MWISKIWIKSILIAIICLPCVVSAAWKDEACGIFNLEQKWCNIISKNYTQPYCVTNFQPIWGESSDVNYANECIWPALTNKLSKLISDKSNMRQFSTRDFIQEYCLALYWNSDSGRIYFAKPSWQTNDWDWQQTFDSHQSLFLYALCSSFTESWDNHPFINDNAILSWVYKWDLVKLLKLQQKSSNWNLCSLDYDYWIQDCDMSIYATKIYEWIMSDLFKIKYAQVLNVDNAKDFAGKKQEKVEYFMSGYYKIHEKYKDLKDEYPKTISILESNQKFYKKVLDDVRIIDNSKLADLSNESWCPVTWNMSWLDFIACALHSSQWDWFSLTPSFVTLFYNELLHYRQFVAFYKKFMNKDINMTEAKKEALIKESKKLDFELYFEKQMEATEEVQRSFEEFSMTYPLHIWMLLYTEKAERFRNGSLSKIVTSFYSLSEKLQNVQKPNEN